ncbi:hypothetical protein FTX61_07170 [Nitriliruptoraceae bacterium ZYF776]|nr:hypothetical protein [Profundirhabdus halotolerans]
MFRHAVRLTAIRGIDVRLDPSLVLLAVLLGWLLYGRFVLAHGQGLAVVMAGVASLLFFASILAHEVAHALEARHRGIEVDSITLLLFGGVTQMHTESRRPRDEFVVAAVGPYISLVCAAAFGLVSAAANLWLPTAAAVPVVELSRLLALVNLALAVFNLVPGAPLDGGRVLRAGLWWLLGDRARAIRVAAWAGIAFALLLVGVGVWVGVRGWPVTATTGLWWIVIGVFLLGAARVELRHGRTQGALRGRTVAEVVPAEPVRVRLEDPVGRAYAAAIERRQAGRTGDPVLVTDADGEVVGWLEPRELDALHPADRELRVARDLLHPAASVPAVELTTSLQDLVERFVHGEHDRVRVEDAGRTVAVLSEARVARTLERLRRGDGLPTDAVGVGP